MNWNTPFLKPTPLNIPVILLWKSIASTPDTHTHITLPYSCSVFTPDTNIVPYYFSTSNNYVLIHLILSKCHLFSSPIASLTFILEHLGAFVPFSGSSFCSSKLLWVCKSSSFGNLWLFYLWVRVSFPVSGHGLIFEFNRAIIWIMHGFEVSCQRFFLQFVSLNSTVDRTDYMAGVFAKMYVFISMFFGFSCGHKLECARVCLGDECHSWLFDKLPLCAISTVFFRFDRNTSSVVGCFINCEVVSCWNKQLVEPTSYGIISTLLQNHFRHKGVRLYHGLWPRLWSTQVVL